MRPGYRAARLLIQFGAWSVVLASAWLHLVSTAPASPPQEKSGQSQLEPSADLVFGTGHLRGSNACMAFSPDSRFAVTAGETNKIHFWDPESGELRDEWTSKFADFLAITFSPDGKLLAAAGGRDGNLSVWDVEARKEILARPGAGQFRMRISSLAFSPDGKRLVAGTNERAAHIWETENWEHLGTVRFGPRQEWSTVKWSPDGKRLIAGVPGTVYVFEGNTFDLLNEISTFDNTYSFDGLSFVTESQLLTSATQRIRKAGETEFQAQVKLWDINSGELLRTIYQGELGSLANGSCLTPDKSRLIIRAEYEFQVLDLQQGIIVRRLGRMQSRPVSTHQLAISPDGKLLALAYGTRTVLQLFDLASGTRIVRRESGHDCGLVGLAVSPDSTQLATVGRDNLVRIWDARSGDLTAEFDCGVEMTPGVAGWSPDGQRLYVGGQTYDRKLNRVGFLFAFTQTGQLAFRMVTDQVVKGIAFSADGQHLAVYQNIAERTGNENQQRTIEILEANTGRRLQKFTTSKPGERFGLQAMTFLADRERLMSVALPRVDTWDLRQGQLRFEDYLGIAFAARFARQGELLAMVTGYETIEIFNTQSMQQLRSVYRPGHRFNHIAYSADGRFLAATSWEIDERRRTRLHPYDLRVWDTETRELIYQVPDIAMTPVMNLVFSPDNKWLYAASDQGIAAGWDLSEVTQE